MHCVARSTSDIPFHASKSEPRALPVRHGRAVLFVAVLDDDCSETGSCLKQMFLSL